jgi:hypothetical protein
MRGFTSLIQGVGGILHHHGVKGYLSNVTLLRDADEESTRWAMFYQRWYERHGSQPVTASTLWRSAQHNPRFGEADPWEDTFITGANGRPPSSTKALGKWLATERGRPRKGWRITGEKDRKEVTWWRLERLDGQHIVTIPEVLDHDSPA